MQHMRPDDPLALAVVAAIQTGDVETLKRLLDENPGLATARIVRPASGGGSATTSRTLLHVATDWPGHFPNGAETAAALIAAGGEVNARIIGPHTETPLHWAASCDDVGVLDVLLDHGADIEAPGAVIGGGTPLADAVAFGQWQAARRLVERGARTTLWQAAAVGLLDRVQEFFQGETALSPHDVTNAFWCACHGGQRAPAEYLLDRGADRDWIGYDGLTPLDAAQRSGAEELVNWLSSQGAQCAKKLS
jgi:uncharacterized protein